VGERYRILHPTLGLLLKDGREVAHTVPAGTVVETDGQSLGDEKLIEVIWDGLRVRIFAQDLQARSVPAD
jgi:hypothetical protein